MPEKKDSLLSKGIAVIEQLAVLGKLSVAQLSEKTNIPRSSVYRILCILEDIGYASRTKKEYVEDVWSLDHIFLSLSAAILDRMELKTILKDILVKLAEDTQEIVQLSVFKNNRVVFIDNIKIHPSIVSVPPVGSSLSINSCVSGLIFGAYLDSSIVNSALETSDLPKRTQFSLTDPEALRAKFKQIRKDGYAVDDQYYAIGHRCVGAPIFDYSAKIVAEINVSGHLQTITDDRIELIARKVMESANEASIKLGFGKKTMDGANIISVTER